MTEEVWVHRILVKPGSVTAVRERIERVLDVRTEVEPDAWKWAITFPGPRDIDLDFLRPDVLPPGGDQ